MYGANLAQRNNRPEIRKTLLTAKEQNGTNYQAFTRTHL